MGVVEAIFVTAGGGQPMQRVDEVQAVAGAGLSGDRYAEHTGYWSGVDECQVTFIEAEALDGITGSTDVRVTEGQHRRNVVVRGVELRALAGATFTVGEATFSYDRPRPPCRYIESITQPGMTRALAARRGGVGVRGVGSGVLRVGDELVVEDVSRVSAWFDRLR